MALVRCDAKAMMVQRRIRSTMRHGVDINGRSSSENGSEEDRS